jgi:adenylate cyclase
VSLLDEVSADVDEALSGEWSVRDGEVVPESEDVALGNEAVKLSATMLYSDLADSTALAMYDWRVAARLFKAFLACASRVIRARQGQIRSFDGDRVMGVFIGDAKNTSAVKCGLQINWVFQYVLKPKFEARYEKLRDGSYVLSHCTGIDTGDVRAVRAGMRQNNDLVWVGRAPNVAAKLCGLREEPYRSYITGEVFDFMHESVKTTDGRPMWEERTWTDGPVKRIFRSSWWWRVT